MASTGGARVGKLFVKKSISFLKQEASAAGGGAPALKRSLSAWSLIALGIGCIIGAGIFVLTGNAAATNAGPAVALSFIVSGAVCALAGLCYAEMASAVPVSGSAYTYAYATLGEFIAWIIGWDLILEYSFGATAVAIGWSGYVVSFLHDVGIPISNRFASSPFAFDAATGAWSQTGAILNLPAMLIIAAVSALLVLGTRESARLNNIIVVIKVTIVLLFVVAGASYFDSKNWVTAANPQGLFIPPNEAPGEFGWSGVLRAAAIVFFAYIGFDAVSTAAQEAKNPRRDMPIGILGSLGICTILYVLVSVVITGIVPYDKLDVPDPIAVGIDATGLTWLQPLISLGAVLGLTSAILVLLLGQSRILFSMAHDGLLPPRAASIQRRYHTPYVSTILVGSAAALLAGLLPIGLVAELVSIGTLMAFAIVCIGVLVLRITKPNIDRPFKVPAIYLVAPLGALSAFGLMLGLPETTWTRLLVWMALGLAVYLTYSVRHSVVRHPPASRATRRRSPS
jgi:APA family basic amino acid/polyamine antiporter